MGKDTESCSLLDERNRNSIAMLILFLERDPLEFISFTFILFLSSLLLYHYIYASSVKKILKRIPIFLFSKVEF